jgi:Fe-S cluster biogenesis protein NfuA
MKKAQKIDKKALVNSIANLRTWIQNDGGDMELVDVDHVNNAVTIRISGACVDCMYFDHTFHRGVKSSLKKNHPGIKKIHFIVKK